MGLISKLAILVAIATLLFSLIKPVAADSKNFQDLQSRMASELIIEFSKSDFIKYVMTESREYDVLIYYTLTSKCTHCVTIEDELKEVAYSYVQSKKHLSEGNPNRPVIFAKMEYNADNAEIFAASDYTSVPILALAKPSIVKKFISDKIIEYPDSLEWKISSQDFFDAGKLLEHINKITNSDVELKYTFYRIMMGNILIFGVLAVLFFFKDHIAEVLQLRIVWIVGTVIIYILWIGGTAFNMIHQVPTFRYGYDSSGSVVVEEYIQKNQRSQYSGEGYMISMLMMTIGAWFVVFSYLNRIKNPISKEIICLGVILGIFSLVTILNMVFTMKANGYHPTFMPPEHYVSGPLANDQGTNI